MKIFDHKILKNSIYSLIIFIFVSPILVKASDNGIEEILVVGSLSLIHISEPTRPY